MRNWPLVTSAFAAILVLAACTPGPTEPATVDPEGGLVPVEPRAYDRTSEMQELEPSVDYAIEAERGEFFIGAAISDPYGETVDEHFAEAVRLCESAVALFGDEDPSFFIVEDFGSGILASYANGSFPRNMSLPTGVCVRWEEPSL